ncbi:TetR/AcrR family transcriptional regulator, partial [Streptomyces hygroscopicus]
GLDILFAPGLRAAHPELQESSREFVALLLPSAFEVIAPGEGAEAAVALLDALNALARGYVAQLLEGKFGDPEEVAEDVATRATRAARVLVAGYGLPSGAADG